ncbi:hypothetical protein L596_027023 [Steinernema carpocapsae]|uniref:DUF8206 domain-containing protein n=1 Tax=Steinernema carpocapsae TaxID=34508 RepID=A0A4U5M330_STECR|nr:hypothetical protein L596_027023 [Steinernema carpocapsae]
MSFNVRYHLPDSSIKEETFSLSGRPVTVEEVVQGIFQSCPSVNQRQHWAHVWEQSPGLASTPVSLPFSVRPCLGGYSYVVQFHDHWESNAHSLQPSTLASSHHSSVASLGLPPVPASRAPCAAALPVPPKPSAPLPPSPPVPPRNPNSFLPQTDVTIRVRGNFFTEFTESVNVGMFVKLKLLHVHNNRLSNLRAPTFQVVGTASIVNKFNGQPVVLDLQPNNVRFVAGETYEFSYEQQASFAYIPAGGVILFPRSSRGPALPEQGNLQQARSNFGSNNSIASSVANETLLKVQTMIKIISNTAPYAFGPTIISLKVPHKARNLAQACKGRFKKQLKSTGQTTFRVTVEDSLQTAVPHLHNVSDDRIYTVTFSDQHFDSLNVKHAFNVQLNGVQTHNAFTNNPNPVIAQPFQTPVNGQMDVFNPATNQSTPKTLFQTTIKIVAVPEDASRVFQSRDVLLSAPLTAENLALQCSRLAKLSRFSNSFVTIVVDQNGMGIPASDPLKVGNRYAVTFANPNLNYLTGPFVFPINPAQPAPQSIAGSSDSVASIPPMPTSSGLQAPQAPPQKRKDNKKVKKSSSNQATLPLTLSANLSQLTLSEPENVVDYEEALEKYREPFPKCNLELACPKRECPEEKKTWSCVECKTTLVYGFDDFLYCECGRLNPSELRFKCNFASHNRPVPHRQLLSELRQIPLKKYNILVLGATGVGKSTWINATMNYVTYATFEEALSGTLHSVIPMRYTGHHKDVLVGDWNEEELTNELHSTGESCTQRPKAYTFMFEGSQFTLIDVPGFGDTRGTDIDKENRQMIMRELQNYEDIHGICYLSQSNSARLTLGAKYVLGELTTQLHQDAVNNLLFCFTGCDRGVNSAGDNKQALQHYLAEFETEKGISIRLSTDNMFYFENQAVEFIAYDKNQVPPPFKKVTAKDSFKLSRDQTMKLLGKVMNLPPHQTRKMLSINDARRIIRILTPILAKITENSQNNEHALNCKMRELDELQQESNQLEASDHSKLLINYLETTPIPYPRTVCHAEQCIETVEIPNSGGRTSAHFKTICHAHCYLGDVMENRIPDPGLRFCAAMSGENCRGCGCPWDKHMHIRYLQEFKTKEVDNPAVKRQIDQNGAQKTSKQTVIDGIQEQQRKLKDEEKRIFEICAKFCVFLNQNAIRDSNDAFEEMLKQVMETELNSNSFDAEKYGQYEKALRAYQEEKRLFVSSLRIGETEPVGINDINALKNKLICLPVNGASIKEALDILEEEDRKYVRETVKRFDPKA